MENVYLITRVDDAGLCESVNDAVLDAASSGLVRNVSIMVPGPAFGHAAERLKHHKELCLGLHVTLNIEWEGFRWRPLSPAAEVRSIVDSEGCFLPAPVDLHERGSSALEMMTEVRRQLDTARKAGLDIRYIDEHMGVGWVCSLREQLAELARSEGLMDAYEYSKLPKCGDNDIKTLGEAWANWVAAAPAGVHVHVSHVGFDRDDLRRCHLPGKPERAIAAERDAERRAWHDGNFRRAIESRNMTLLRYDDTRLPDI